MSFDISKVCTKDYCIVYGNSQNIEIPPKNDGDKELPDVLIMGYADANHGGDKDDRKSTTGYIFINNGLMSWQSHNQSSDAISTMEPEYMAISDASRDAIAKAQFYTDPDTILYVTHLSDSQSALALIVAAINYQRANHIDLLVV